MKEPFFVHFRPFYQAVAFGIWVVDPCTGTGPGPPPLLFTKLFSKSMGKGNTIVEFFSAEMWVWKSEICFRDFLFLHDFSIAIDGIGTW